MAKGMWIAQIGLITTVILKGWYERTQVACTALNATKKLWHKIERKTNNCMPGLLTVMFLSWRTQTQGAEKQ